jgi:hypothetical protein
MTVELSPSRLRLREALDAKASELANMQKASAAVARLEAIKAAVEPISVELRQFDSAQAASFARYAEQGGDVPVMDTVTRNEIVERLDNARAAAGQAQAALAKPTADHDTLAAKIDDIGLWAQLRTSSVLLEETESLFPSLVEATTIAARIKDRVFAGIAEARRIATAVQSKNKNLPSDAFRDADNLEKALNRLELPVPERSPRVEWSAFADRLASDYQAKFESKE